MARKQAGQQGLSVEIVFCSGDTGKILIARPEDMAGQLDQRDIRFHFGGDREDLVQRFSIYGVRATTYECLWRKGPLCVSEEPLLKLLFEQLCRNEQLLALFHSYYNIIGKQYCAKIVEGEYSEQHMGQLVEDSVSRLARKVTSVGGVSNPEDAASAIKKSVQEDIGRLVEGDGSTADWLRVDLDKLSRLIRDTSIPETRTRLLARVRARGQKRHDVGLQIGKQITSEFRQLQNTIRQELVRIRILHGEDMEKLPLAAQEQEDLRKRWLDEQGGLDLPPELMEYLLQGNRKIADVFERCVGLAVADLVARDEVLGDIVASVYQNIELARAGQRVCELDTVVILCTGDLIVLEAKTHYRNADRKKVEANIKQLRDFGGAYSKYALVFPLRTQDVEDLASGENDRLGRFRDAGMTDARGWAHYVKQTQSSRDQTIVGLDTLGTSLRNAVSAYL
jgi:hypothetical protein